MAAPALVVLARDGADPRVLATVTALVAEVRSRRGDLRVEAAWLDRPRTGLGPVVARLAAAGHEEVVVVPLEVGEGTDVAFGAALAGLDQPGTRVRVTAGLGLEPCFLEVLDERLRESLRVSRVRELDALVLAADGSPDPLANQSVARLGRLWGTHHRLPVTAAFASTAPPATGEAVRAFRAQGRRHVAVASLFLSAGPLTDRATELALEAGAVAVSAPLGAHPEVARTVLARYAVGAVELVPV